MLEPLAEQGDPNAQYLLATAYANGTGVTQSWQSAAYGLLRAAKQGAVWAQVGIGALYTGGFGVPRD